MARLPIAVALLVVTSSFSCLSMQIRTEYVATTQPDGFIRLTIKRDWANPTPIDSAKRSFATSFAAGFLAQLAIRNGYAAHAVGLTTAVSANMALAKMLHDTNTTIQVAGTGSGYLAGAVMGDLSKAVLRNFTR